MVYPQLFLTVIVRAAADAAKTATATVVLAMKLVIMVFLLSRYLRLLGYCVEGLTRVNVESARRRPAFIHLQTAVCTTSLPLMSHCEAQSKGGWVGKLPQEEV